MAKKSAVKHAEPQKQPLKKVVVAGMIGNGLEWYDYALYGHFAVLISQLYFPSDDKFISLIATFGVYAAGFIMRPLGAVLFGIIGDKVGRRSSLAISILLMAIPTGCIAFLPTYAEIGIAAPILLTIIRLLQGAALGGEFTGSITYIVEHADKERRGIAGSTSLISMMIGMLLGSAAAMLCSNLLPKEEFEDWGWRIPFLIGLFIGFIGIYIRSYLHESPMYEEAKKKKEIAKKPISMLFKSYKQNMMVGIGLYIAVTIPFYMLTVFMNTYMSKILSYEYSQTMIINTITMTVILFILPISALVSDQIGRKPVMLYSLVGMLVLAYPIFWLITQNDFMYALAGQVIFAIVLGIYIAPIPAILVEIFPTKVRYSGMALTSNIAAVFGGLCPIISTKLIQSSGNNMVLAYFIIAACLVSLVTMLRYKETYKADVF